MLEAKDFRDGMAALISCLPRRENSEAEETVRERLYAKLVADLDPRDFREAVEEIILNDDWFPSVARLREMVGIIQERRRLIIKGGEHTVYDEIARIQAEWEAQPERKSRLPRNADGTPDMEAFYQLSRELRGLPPGDDRPVGVAGWKTVRDVLKVGA